MMHLAKTESGKALWNILRKGQPNGPRVALTILVDLHCDLLPKDPHAAFRSKNPRA